ncbi:BZ3500_MvSof-1268-A1-R1_C083g00450 [Microbotryum saponariae]|uniref:BZ3500_MvSof-1268-A1-R1_C083g00450 protein n=1 Tax=Microbotryum saponariae TaxID=289078 RepID=A0A2X0LCT1_9BASI|nr:BZ3500_MvSof-1268-A1-R1_C083g00450 [Microbotryum saponariae]
MDQLIQVLQGTLSADPNARLSAELQLSQLTGQSETALALAQITVEHSLDISLRQISPHSLAASIWVGAPRHEARRRVQTGRRLIRFTPLQRDHAAGFALKKYVKEHWSPFFSTFKGPNATTVEIKAQIRQTIFGGLSDPIRKLRLACAVVVSDIAHPDWPDDWPSLMTQLLQLIGPAASPDAVDGGMRVLNDFVGIDMTEDQLLPIAREMLPRLLEIVGTPQTHSPSTRARAILIFRACVMTLFTVKEEHPVAVKAAVTDILPTWLSAFQHLLATDVATELTSFPTWEALAVRTTVFGALEVILNSFPSTLKALLPIFLQFASNDLAALLPVYSTAFLSSTSEFDVPVPAEGDSQVPADLPGYISTVLDFVTQLAGRKSVKALFLFPTTKSGTQLLQSTFETAILYARMTTDDEDDWASDPNAFVADEDDEMVIYNVRAASIDLTSSLIDQFETAAVTSLWGAFQSRLHDADAARTNGTDADWWKIYEAALALVGDVSSDLLSHVEDQASQNKRSAFDLEAVFTSIIPNYLGATELPFLQGRSFVFASQFAPVLPSQLAHQYIDAAIQVLDATDAGVPVKVSAVRALTNFFRHLKQNVEPSQAAQSIARLLPLLPQTTENTLVLIVEALVPILRVAAPSLDAPTCSSLIQIVLETWFKKPEDPILGVAIGEVFTSLASTPSPIVTNCLQTDALPTLSNILLEIRTDPYSASAASALELIEAILSGRPSGPEHFGPGLFGTVAASLFEVISSTEDRSVTQSGLNIITTVVRKDVGQLLAWKDAQGRSGLELVLQQVAKLLEPDESESGGLFVGDLVLHLIRKAGEQLGPVLPDLLKAFVTRLATAETASFSQSLILPFAYLIHKQADTVLALLEGITVASPTGPRPALQVLLSSWSENVDVFQGFWALKASTVALAELFLSPRPSLSQIVVKGDLLLTDANRNRIMTRARAKNSQSKCLPHLIESKSIVLTDPQRAFFSDPDQFSLIPFRAKALKVLLKDAQSALSESAPNGSGRKDHHHDDDEDDDAESDDGDDEWADEGQEFASGGLGKDLDYLSDLLGVEVGVWGSTLGMRGTYLKDFFHQAYTNDSNHLKALATEYLKQEEKDILSVLLTRA